MCTMRRMTVLCAMKVSCFILSLGEQFKLETPSGDELPTKVLNITSHGTAAS